MKCFELPGDSSGGNAKMSKTAFTITIEVEKPRNRVADAMRKAGTGKHRVMKDSRTKRQNRRSWRKDHGV